MLPKVASLNVLAGAVGVRSAGVRPPTAGTSKRRSFDASSRSRCSSHQDLLALNHDVVDSRPSTPAPLAPVTEATDLCPLALDDASIFASWADLTVSQATQARDAVPHDAAADVSNPFPATSAATPDALLPPVKPAAALQAEPALRVTVPPVKAPFVSSPSSPPSTLNAGECFVYHTTLSFGYLQELLGNLSHVQRMVKGVTASRSPTGAAAAMAAARMLARSLARAATRVRGAAPSPGAVMLAPEGLHTLVEFGWAEVVTYDAEVADALNCTDMELHSPGGGATASYHRANANDPWKQIGEASPGAVSAAYTAFLASSSGGGTSPAGSPHGGGVTAVAPDPLCTSGDGLGALLGRGSGASSALSLTDLADQLVAAGQAVGAAGQLLQQWLDELKTSASGGGTAAPGPLVMAAAGAF